MNTGLFFLYIMTLPWIINPRLNTQETDYISEFGYNWEKAENILAKHNDTFQALTDSFHLSYIEVISIVFPELIRYSAIKDKIEVTLLKTLYVYKGREYADFSIGIFQMKPSFAEKIREETQASHDKNIQALFRSENFRAKNIDHRKQLITELDDPVRQFIYLLAFFKLCENKYANMRWHDKNEKIKFYATAYNCGFTNSEAYIKSMTNKKIFTINTLKTGPYYRYSAIAAYYYNKLNF